MEKRLREGGTSQRETKNRIPRKSLNLLSLSVAGMMQEPRAKSYLSA